MQNGRMFFWDESFLLLAGLYELNWGRLHGGEILQSYFARIPRKANGPALKAPSAFGSFMGLKAHAPSTKPIYG